MKDPKTRAFLQSNPYQLSVYAASAIVDEEDGKFVEQFCKETGDNYSLSKVDRLVMAAGVTLAK